MNYDYNLEYPHSIYLEPARDISDCLGPQSSGEPPRMTVSFTLLSCQHGIERKFLAEKRGRKIKKNLLKTMTKKQSDVSSPQGRASMSSGNIFFYVT